MLAPSLRLHLDWWLDTEPCTWFCQLLLCHSHLKAQLSRFVQGKKARPLEECGYKHIAGCGMAQFLCQCVMWKGAKSQYQVSGLIVLQPLIPQFSKLFSAWSLPRSVNVLSPFALLANTGEYRTASENSCLIIWAHPGSHKCVVGIHHPSQHLLEHQELIHVPGSFSEAGAGRHSPDSNPVWEWIQHLNIRYQRAKDSCSPFGRGCPKCPFFKELSWALSRAPSTVSEMTCDYLLKPSSLIVQWNAMKARAGR